MKKLFYTPFAWVLLIAGFALAATPGLRANGITFSTQTSVPGAVSSSKPVFWTDTTTTAQVRFSDGTNDAYLQKQCASALTDAATINTDASLCDVFTVTLGGNRTLANPTNLVAGYTYMWVVKQDATGSRTLAYGTTFSWPGGTAPTLTTTANAVDLITAVYDGTKLRAVSNLNLQ